MSASLCIFGGGNMGSAIARGVLANGVIQPDSLLVIEHDQAKGEALRTELGCMIAQSPSEVLRDVGLILIAVKPQSIDQALPVLKDFIAESAVILSIMAGVSIRAISERLGGHQRIVKCTANTPAQIGQGLAAYFISGPVTKDQEMLVSEVLDSVGDSFKVDTEDKIDAATATFGSGPGFVYFALKHLLAVCQELGFSEAESELLIRETFRGSLSLWEESGKSPEDLLLQVMSPGGTTQAGIEEFRARGLGESLQAGIRKAYARAKELAS